jgi:uncharacterized protein (TIGR03382 family)
VSPTRFCSRYCPLLCSSFQLALPMLLLALAWLLLRRKHPCKYDPP